MGGANTACFAGSNNGFGFSFLIFILNHLNRLVRTEACTKAATDTKILVHIRDNRFYGYRTFNQRNGRLSCSSLSLDNDFIKWFRGMCQPAKIYALYRQFNRTQFHVGFKEEVVFIYRNLEKLA